ncbi:hypothetical protein [Labrenzia sp. DG1229]|uniref:hypothetical protein n=1 Tax=Labrenzia sp. DG1229 TaxID=681847 RepID=UPI0012EC89BE|nr:hypothetical protein [Labrenzia sp. DG1229]
MSLKCIPFTAAWLAVLLIFVFGSVSEADTVEVPLLPDGTVDLEKVIPSFRANNQVLTTGPAPEFTGSLLGQPYTAAYDDADVSKPFDLIITSENLPEHGHYLIAVALIDSICSRSDLRPDWVLWHETSKRSAEGWSVEVSCSKESR